MCSKRFEPIEVFCLVFVVYNAFLVTFIVDSDTIVFCLDQGSKLNDEPLMKLTVKETLGIKPFSYSVLNSTWVFPNLIILKLWTNLHLPLSPRQRIPWILGCWRPRRTQWPAPCRSSPASSFGHHCWWTQATVWNGWDRFVQRTQTLMDL